MTIHTDSDDLSCNVCRGGCAPAKLVGRTSPCSGPHCCAVSCVMCGSEVRLVCCAHYDSDSDPPEEPVLAPPLNLKRLTAAVLKTAIDTWIPASATKLELDSQKPSSSCHQVRCCCFGVWTVEEHCHRTNSCVKNARFNLMIYVADGAPSNTLIKKSEVAPCQTSRCCLDFRLLSLYIRLG